jgi:hypothetical protein
MDFPNDGSGWKLLPEGPGGLVGATGAELSGLAVSFAGGAAEGWGGDGGPPKHENSPIWGRNGGILLLSFAEWAWRVWAAGSQQRAHPSISVGLY